MAGEKFIQAGIQKPPVSRKVLKVKSEKAPEVKVKANKLSPDPKLPKKSIYVKTLRGIRK